MKTPVAVCLVVAVCGMLIAADEPAAPGADPLTESGRSAIRKTLEQRATQLSARIEADRKNSDLYSQRGDMRFFSGQFRAAVEDYEKMVELQPDLETSHWRRGIAYFYAGRYKDAAHQFEIYHSFDDVDRENGIWRFFSQAKASGIEKARKGLLKYKKDDREPFPDLYRMFAGELTAEQVLSNIAAAKIDAEERRKRLFYAELYVGLNAFIDGDLPSARQHLREAVANPWPEQAGFGPRYMWYVGLVHYEQLLNEMR